MQARLNSRLCGGRVEAAVAENVQRPRAAARRPLHQIGRVALRNRGVGDVAPTDPRGAAASPWGHHVPRLPATKGARFQWVCKVLQGLAGHAVRGVSFLRRAAARLRSCLYHQRRQVWRLGMIPFTPRCSIWKRG